MKTLCQKIVCATAVLTLAIGAGCGRSGNAPEAAAETEGAAQAQATSASGLPGAQAAMASLDKKDYPGAVAAVLQARQSVGNAEQQNQFVNLVDEVKIRLIDEAPTDPKAAEALAVLRQITGGR
jgi:hypothetical protein